MQSILTRAGCRGIRGCHGLNIIRAGRRSGSIRRLRSGIAFGRKGSARQEHKKVRGPHFDVYLLMVSFLRLKKGDQQEVVIIND